MANRDKRGRLCGKMKVEEVNHKHWKEQYLILDLDKQVLQITDDFPENLPKTYERCAKIELNFISKVSDARKARPKAPFCFSITHSGEVMYIQANTEEEMNTWIEQLNDACRITVPQTKSPCLAPENSRNEVVGGLVITTFPEPDSGEESLDHNMPALSLPSFKSGYAIKQGAVRKNWKRRYFVLDSNGLSYYKHDQEKEPIKTVPLSDIIEAKETTGQHHSHRQHLFEVITSDRIFYIQCDKQAECESWISQINKFAKHVISDSYGPVTAYKSTTAQPSSQEAVNPGKSVWV